MKPIRQTFQAHKGVDTPCVAFVRDDAGRADLGSGGEASWPEMEVVVRHYGKQHAATRWPATGDALGKVDFTVPADHKLAAGVYRLDIRAATETDAVLAHAGLLEIV